MSRGREGLESGRRDLAQHEACSLRPVCHRVLVGTRWRYRRRNRPHASLLDEPLRSAEGWTQSTCTPSWNSRITPKTPPSPRRAISSIICGFSRTSASGALATALPQAYTGLFLGVLSYNFTVTLSWKWPSQCPVEHSINSRKKRAVSSERRCTYRNHSCSVRVMYLFTQAAWIYV